MLFENKISVNFHAYMNLSKVKSSTVYCNTSSLKEVVYESHKYCSKRKLCSKMSKIGNIIFMFSSYIVLLHL